jgi:hypothetical protein
MKSNKMDSFSQRIFCTEDEVTLWWFSGSWLRASRESEADSEGSELSAW